MAEQSSHNVVDESQSASASALADVTANHANAGSAETGNETDNSQSNDRKIRHDASTPEVDTDTKPATVQAGENMVTSAAEPSAGDVAPIPEVPTVTLEQISEGQDQSGQSSTANGVHDAAGQAEGSADDGSTADISVDHSVHSDTDGSKADGADQKMDGNHHVRTNSVKKPTTFSKVSVTKQFMAKSASPVPHAAKAGDKPSGVGAALQPTAKPRLVAKTGSSLQTIQKARSNADSLSGPDASRVWNKNRPAPVAPPKQFTDEELKQQYGIHLATRLQTDEDGKESKWADIDDDEDDWAPETVVWMDGTKSTLTPAEITPAPEEQKPEPVPAPKPAVATRPILALKKAGESGPPKTILKPGVVALQAKQPNGASTASPGGERPSLKAKSPAPSSSKSPWAVLPPIEAVSPLNPPVQPPLQVAHASMLPPQDARAYEPQPPPQPAREIAADTFDRSWREGEGGARELFNSANGRYEPVPEGRRTSIKPDSAQRKPSVLQRPSQSGVHPAEPSSAFQSRTSNQVDGASWQRRRGSSVSQGSIPPARRTSMSKPSDLQSMAERRLSVTSGHDPRASPLSARNEAVKPSFAPQSAWDQQMPPRPEPGTGPEVEDPVKIQERVMREKRELAVKRRKEEEERLETEKQERLKAKLAALEGAGKSKKEREAEAAAAATAVTTEAEKPVELTTSTPKPTDATSITSQSAAAPVTLASELEAQPASAASEPIRESQALEESLPLPLPPKPEPVNLLDQSTPSVEAIERPAPRGNLSPKSSAHAPFGQQPSGYRQPTSSYSSPGDRKNQPFGRSPLTTNDSFTPWPSTLTNGNVWGTAGIGNGTFEKASSFAPMTQQNSILPPPPGMGRPATANRISPQGYGQESRSPSLHQSQLAEQSRTFPPPGIESRPEAAWNQSRANGVSPAPGLGRAPHAPGPIAPPSRAHQQQQQHQPVQRPDALLAWNNAAQRLPHQYAAEAQAAERIKQSGPTTSPREDTIKETFKQTSAQQGKLGGPRKYAKTEVTIHDGQGSRTVSEVSPAPPNAQTQPIGPVPTASPLNAPHSQVGENTVRIPDGSLNPAHGGLPNKQPPIAPPHRRQAPLSAYQGNVKFPASPLAPVVGSKDQSPPPPETSSHPVNSGGDAKHPLVRLPPPPPVVKLPPAPATLQSPPKSQTTVMLPQRPVQVWGPPGAARPIVQSEDWQARFNGLFNRASIQTEVPPSPPKTPPKIEHGPALAVASSSKALMDDLPTASSATVSLPQNGRRNVTEQGFTIDDSEDVISKPTIDKMFNEELSFGSLPKITVPRNPVYDAEVYHSQTQNNMLKMGPNSRLIRSIDPQSKSDLDIRAAFHRHPQGIFVKLAGMKANRLARYGQGARKASAPQPRERKPSAKHHHPKSNNAGALESPAAGATPNGGSRKTSFQKTPTPTSGTPTTTSSPANAENGKKKDSKWPRPPRGRSAPTTSA